jgi:hypothetical protein
MVDGINLSMLPESIIGTAVVWAVPFPCAECRPGGRHDLLPFSGDGIAAKELSGVSKPGELTVRLGCMLVQLEISTGSRQAATPS